MRRGQRLLDRLGMTGRNFARRLARVQQPESKMSDIQLEVRDIAKRFGAVAALDSVSLTLRRGRVHTLLGKTAPENRR